MTTPLVVGLQDLERGDLAVAGGKGANLGELLRAGFPVPAGFVVTTRAYSLAAGRAGLDDVVVAERLAMSVGGASRIRDALAAVPVPPAVAEAIGEAHGVLGGGPVAVRSSATAEDLPGAAFAGQQDTYLNVVGDSELLDAVRRCWASLWTDRAVSYRESHGVGHGEVRIAVVVQKMVDAESAGVIFTANPVTGDRDEFVVDVSPGLGEAVVSGLVTPDHYVLDEHGRVADWSAGRREVVVRAVAGGGVEHSDGGAAGGGMEQVGREAPGVGASQAAGDAAPGRLLTDRQLGELARAGTAVARHFGRPQDIEWAYEAGRLWLLQARPMTALPPPPVRLNRAQRLMGTALHEYLPQRPYPIDASSWLVDGPAGMMAKVAGSIGLRGAFQDFLVEQDGVVVSFLPRSPRPSPAVLAAPFRLGRRARRYDPRRWTEDERFEAFLERNAELAALDLPSLPWAELIRVPRRAVESLEPLTQLRIDYLPGVGSALLRLGLALKLLGAGDRLAGLLGGAPTRTADANRALEDLAQTVRADPALMAAFTTLEPRELAGVVPQHAGFQAALDALLREYGHRETTTPALLTPPTWADSPETVLGLVKVLAGEAPTRDATGVPAQAPTPPATRSPNLAPTPAPTPAPTASSDRALAALLASPAVRRLGLEDRLRRWVDAARSGVAFREDTHFYMTKPLPVLRRSILEIGRRLVQAGVLEEPADVFHLRLEELEAISDPQGLDEAVAAELRTKMRQRSARREELAGVPLINLGSLFPPRPVGVDALVTGTPASGGTASGPVRVIRGPEEFANLGRGDVLVCPYTNPSWTPLFQRAAAVVVDSGSVASHAAIVAREYGVPAVVATRVGTSVLEDGQWVTVDGTTGRVTAAASPGSKAPSDGNTPSVTK